jgi:hypothetical protein
MGKPEGRRPLERPRSRWEDIIQMDIRELRWSADWMDLAQNRKKCSAPVNVIMHLRVQ